MDFAVAQKIISENPCKAVALPKLEHKGVQTIPAEQLQAFLQEAKATGVYEMYYIELATGLRRGDLLGLKWQELYFNEYDGTAEIYTYNTKLKKRLTTYAATYPDLCQLTEDNSEGGLRFEIDKSRISIRLTAPYSEQRRRHLSQKAKNGNFQS